MIHRKLTHSAAVLAAATAVLGGSAPAALAHLSHHRIGWHTQISHDTSQTAVRAGVFVIHRRGKPNGTKPASPATTATTASAPPTTTTTASAPPTTTASTPAKTTASTPPTTTTTASAPPTTTTTASAPPTTTPPSTTTAATPPATGTAPASTVAMPTGVSGSWNLAFDDEFNGSSLNLKSWSTHDGWTGQNGVTDEASNVTISGGYANLDLASANSGAAIATNTEPLAVGDFAEARVSMPGSGATMDDWDAFWASGPGWPAAGENDIAESLGGQLTVNYHSPSGSHNQGGVNGDWAGEFHTYGIYRGTNYVDVYWDGKLVKTYSTDDDGQPETIIFTAGNGQGDPLATGAAGTMKIDYVRVWTPA